MRNWLSGILASIIGGLILFIITNDKCVNGKGLPDFDGNGCRDTYEFQGLGKILEGDFNGDKLTDLAHVVTKNVDDPWYVHIHFSDASNLGSFKKPTRYDFRNTITPSYDATTGAWNANGFNNDGLTNLLHDSKRGVGLRYWKSNGNGAFEEIKMH